MNDEEISKLLPGIYKIYFNLSEYRIGVIGISGRDRWFVTPESRCTEKWAWPNVMRVEKIDVDYISCKSAALKEAAVWRKNAENQLSKNIVSQISFMNYDKGTGSLPALSDKVESCYLGDSYKDGYYTGVIGGFAADGICIVVLDKPIDGVMAISIPSVCLRKVIKKVQKITVVVNENFLDIGPTLSDCDCTEYCLCKEPGLTEILVQYYRKEFDQNISKLLAAAYVKKAFCLNPK